MEKCFLTNGGNLLRHFETSLIGTNGVGAKRFYFQKPNGEFIREVSDSEAEYLCQNCLEVQVTLPPEIPEFLLLAGRQSRACKLKKRHGDGSSD